jgi:hypothetical protein
MYINKSKKDFYLSFIVMIFLFLFFLNIPDISNIFIMLTIPVILLSSINISWDLFIKIILLCGFSFSYHFISIYHGLLTFDFKSIFISLLIIYIYIIGDWLGGKNKNIFLVLTITSLGMLIFGYLSIFSYMTQQGSFILIDRKAPSFWDDFYINGPMLESYIAVGLSYITSIFIFKYSWKKAMYIVLAFLSFLSAFALQGRGAIFLAVIYLFITLIIIYLNSTKNYKIIKFLQFSILFFLFIVLLLIFRNDIFNIINSNSIQYYLNKSIESPRYNLWFKGFEGLLKYPLGGAMTNFDPFSYAHNFWLDIGWYAGLLPVLFIIIFQFLNFKYIWELKNINLKEFIFTLGIFILIFGKLFLEPIIFGGTKIMLYSIFFLGYIRGYIINNKLL